jgi:hypothetical protein
MIHGAVKLFGPLTSKPLQTCGCLVNVYERYIDNGIVDFLVRVRSLTKPGVNGDFVFPTKFLALGNRKKCVDHVLGTGLVRDVSMKKRVGNGLGKGRLRHRRSKRFGMY